MIQVGLPHFLVVAALLFAAGLACALVRRSAIAVLVGIELMLNAAGLNLVAFSRYGSGTLDGQLFALFLIVLAAAEAAVVLALVLAIHRRTREADVDHLDTLKG
ncbi:MAG TPA: NADH-quinone oxidoreductase subunit NuoK [Myxococcota bacterium]|nr:NADH-quinone oxidoreductase subunit NuoK [Myxococcota bacterium]HRY96547.1 NADH-quinone oxidoreductase subunit NuoK [Myxococcota bacterium]HSA21901.1 NADH-quinone oxidoreductase subunit NuoK [Myxococcota bacterium]